MRSTRVSSFFVVFLTIVFMLFIPARTFGQYIVDCSGNAPGAYTTINSVLPLLSNGAAVRISGLCKENLTMNRPE